MYSFALFASRSVAMSVYFICCRENAIPICLSKVGQKFRNLEDGWLFWVKYGGCVGFDVRKRSS
jgi:hypothetical protein